MHTPVQQRVKLNAAFWSHDLSVPLGSDLAPASLFQNHQDYLVVDIETKTLVDAVGGWKNFRQLEVSVACAYDSKTDQFLSFTEGKLGDLVDLCRERLLIGYNLVGFDLPVLEKYGLPPAAELDVFDLMLDIHAVSGWKFVKLDRIATATLGVGKSAEGTQAVEWWKQGEVQKIIDYCLQDVKVTRDIFLHGLNQGWVRIERAEGPPAQFNVSWS
ncbi:MAG: ribonuclease H-like domain-containing protein [Bdellovibrionales bacterium]|nr:ribonuclease H-like domain-containing protein [Bdellovibrionales bacterium]